MVASTIGNAGNPERRGQAGASQLLINPYARNSGMVGSNSAKVRGIEAQFLNIAGTAAYTSSSFTIPANGSVFTYVPTIGSLAAGQYSGVVS